MPIRSSRKSETYFDFFSASGKETEPLPFIPKIFYGDRAVAGGGSDSDGDYQDDMYYYNIASTGNASSFGDIGTERIQVGACSDSSRGLFWAGWFGNPSLGVGGIDNTIDYVTISTTGNASNFGNLSQVRYGVGACASDVRGVGMGGDRQPHSPSPGVSNVMDYVTIQTTGDASDFGDATQEIWLTGGCSNGVRGIWAGGRPPESTDVIQYTTIASTGNATDFGDLEDGSEGIGACGSTEVSSRCVLGGGKISGQPTNKIEYINANTTGNGTDFGNLTVKRQGSAPSANGVRACWLGGYTDPSVQYSIDYVTIATTGNASDFGDNYGNQPRRFIGGTSGDAS